MATDGLPEIAEQLVKQVTPYAYLGNPQFIDTKALLERAMRLAIQATAYCFTHGCSDEKMTEIAARIAELLKAEVKK